MVFRISLLFGIALGLIMCNSVFSQQALGFEFGYKRSNFNTDVTTTPFRRASRICIGIQYQKNVGLFNEKKSVLKTGLYYEGKGSVAISTRLDINLIPLQELDVHNVLYYWTLPVILEIYPFGNVFFVEGGLFASYLSDNYFSESGLYELDRYDNGIGTFVPIQPKKFTSWDFGLSLGLGVSIPLSERAEMKLTGRYTHGLTNINDDPRFQGNSFKNNGLLFSLGFNWLLGKT